MRSVLSLFEAAAEAACGVDAGQRIVLWNRAAETLMGLEARAALGRRCFEVFGGRDERDCAVCGPGCPVFRLVRGTSAAPTQTIRVLRRDGGPLWLSVSTIAIPSRCNVEAVLVHLFRDVSRQKACETAVSRLLSEVASGPRGDRVEAEDVPAAATPCLTRREHEVLRLLATAGSTRDIAATLHVSPSTVRNHVHSILRKLDAHSRLEAVTMALRYGLIRDLPGPGSRGPGN